MGSAREIEIKGEYTRKGKNHRIDVPKSALKALLKYRLAPEMCMHRKDSKKLNGNQKLEEWKN